MPYIYTINCPITNQVKYVGKANNPEIRFRSHLQSAKNKDLYDWINHILDEGFNPILRVIDRATDNRSIFDLEASYIEHFWKIGSILNKSLSQFRHDEIDYNMLRMICKSNKIKYRSISSYLGFSYCSIAGYLTGHRCQLSYENALRLQKFIISM